LRARTSAVSMLAVIMVLDILAVPCVDAGAPGGKGPAKTTRNFLLYLDADNSLDVYAGAHHESVVESDFLELISVGSTKDAVAYVLVDRYAGPANLFKVLPGKMQELTGFALNGKEANMGDPATLRSFVSYTSKLSPSEHTLLIFWDHGSPGGVAWDDHATDAGGGDFLSQWEVVQALSGYNIDVIGADECNVGHTEVAYEYAVGLQTEYLVAAETYTGWRGFPYDALLRELTNDPSMTPREVAAMMVEQTQFLLDKPPYSGERIDSHSAIDLTKIPDLVASLKELTSLLTPNMDIYAGTVSKARGAAQCCYGANAMNVVDLGTFVERISSEARSQEVLDACNAVLASLDAAIVSMHATGSTDHMLTGLGIGLPNHSWEMSSYYTDFAFAGQGWTDFLEAYWAAAGSI
jgi:hypothetical protein